MVRIFAFVSACLLTVTAAAGIDITQCGQVVAAGQVGVLTADLTCTGGYGVRLEGRATLDLAGFTLDMSDDLSGPLDVAVFCATGEELSHTKCSVTSGAATPGTIRGDSIVYAGILADRAQVENVIVDAFRQFGIYGDKRVALDGVTVSNTVEIGITSNRVVKGTGITIDANGTGISARVVKVSSVMGSGNTTGIGAVKRLAADGVILSGGDTGVRSLRSLRLRSSSITGNTVDVLSLRRPRLVDSVCATSRKLLNGVPSSESWAVCPGE